MRLIVSRIFVAAIGLIVVLIPTSALAWSNGPSNGAGFGTHDWVMYQANELASSRGVTWVDTSRAMRATDDPDTILKDTWNHAYDIWGSPFGSSPIRVAECYGKAVDNLSAGDPVTASYYVGLLSHYFSDTCNPMHTDQSTAEEGYHTPYEDAVDLTATGAESLSGWVADDGHVHVASPAALTQSAAAASHGDYTSLVTGYRQGGAAAVAPITRTRLNQAANGLADIIKSIHEDAFPFVPAPNAVYRFYNGNNGTHFYTPSADEARNAIATWPNIFTYEGISYFADPARNTQPLYRFYNTVSQSHFYTASAQERDTVIARYRSTYTYEGETYRVCPTPASDGTTIYRFYNLVRGSHFYTASAQERDTVIANLPDIYQYEGPAFWVR